MLYYHVWVRSIQFHGNEALTYECAEHIVPGALVLVPLRNQHVQGIIIKKVSKPSFATKPIEVVLRLPPLPPTTLKLISWVRTFYPSSIGVIVNLVLPRTINGRSLPPIAEYPVEPAVDQKAPPLTIEQKTALSIIKKADTYLLHGRTGSGKTRIYTELTERVLSEGRSVMVLSPEIGLTSQLAINFEKLFGNQVVVFHSRLSDKERQRSWLRILATRTPLIVIGPRSVLFSPLREVGLIIVDESHDQAYKHEQAPYYNGIRIAAQLSKIHDAMLVLGSATPTVSDYFFAQKKGKQIIKLQNLAKPQAYDRQVTIVDLKDRSQFARTPHISLPLIKAISLSLAQKEQSLLYLNRRGTARLALCQICGWQATCIRCDIPLVYHGDSHALRCHICGYTHSAIISCPDCRNPSITFRSFGTKAIVDEVKAAFPEARIIRFDADNLKADRLENRYEEVLRGDFDILIGTQMLAKGLDLPRLSTLGVILADSSLYVPDYTAQEKMYQLLTQVIGRIGRGHVKSRAIVQTYQPNGSTLQAALKNDWDLFYASEIAERKKYFFPPFSHILKLTCDRASSESAEKAARSLSKRLKLLDLCIHIDEPAPAFHEKNGGRYIWQLIIKSRERSALLDVIYALPPSGWTYDIDPANLL